MHTQTIMTQLLSPIDVATGTPDVPKNTLIAVLRLRLVVRCAVGPAAVAAIADAAITSHVDSASSATAYGAMSVINIVAVSEVRALDTRVVSILLVSSVASVCPRCGGHYSIAAHTAAGAWRVLPCRKRSCDTYPMVPAPASVAVRQRG